MYNRYGIALSTYSAPHLRWGGRPGGPVYARLVVSRESMPAFASLVRSYLHDSMVYKLGDWR